MADAIKGVVDNPFTPTALAGLSKSEKFERAAAYAGVPVSALQGIYANESSSGADPRAQAPNPASSALGDFQITDGTAAGVQAATGIPINRKDFDSSLFAAAHIMKENMIAFDGDLELATAAYNQGPGKANTPAGLAYAAKALGVQPHPIGDDEITKTDQNNNRVMMQTMFPPSLTANQLADIRPRDIANAIKGQPTKEYLPKSLQSLADTASAMQADSSPTPDIPGQQSVSTAVKDASIDTQLRMQVHPSELSDNRDFVGEQAEGSFENAVDAKQAKDNTSSWEAFKDGFAQNNIVARLSQTVWDQQQHADNYDPSWKYTNAQDDELRNAGYTEAELARARDATGANDLSRIISEIQTQREHDQNNAEHGIAGFAGGLVGGIADPAAWLLTGGVGAGVEAAANAARLGGGALFASRVAAAGLGNVAATAALQAAGSNITSHDYLMAALTGSALGTVGGLFGKAASASLENLRAGMAEAKVDLHLQAARELGPGATAEQIAARANEIDQANFEKRQGLQNSVVLADVPDTQKILPGEILSGETPVEPDAFLHSRESTPAADGSVRTVMNDMADKYHLDTITDEGQKQIVAETLARAERDDVLNPIKPEKLEKIISKLPDAIAEQVRTYGMQLAMSDNPVARYVSRNLMESASGTAERVRTASITKTQLEAISREDWGNFNAVRERYIQEHGSWIDETLHGTASKAFDQQVRDEIYARRFSPPEADELRGVAQRVKEGADALEKAYARQLEWQKSAKTLGWQHLPESARGYIPQRINPQAALLADVGTRKALVKALAAQIQANNHDIDGALATTLANEYVGHAQNRRAGAVERPMNLIDASMSDNVQEALERLGLMGDKAAQKLLNKYQRGGASYTKKRYEFDMEQPVELPDGKQAKLGDFFETNMANLFQRYSARNTGEVALAKYGVYGANGVAMLRKALEQATVHAGEKSINADLHAFDSFMADMLGMPVAEMTGGMKAMRTLRQLSSMNMLGGMGFTQAAETANIATTLGLRSMLASIPLFRQMFKDARLMRDNQLFHQIELIGGRSDAFEKWHFPSEVNPGDVQIYGHDTPGLITRGLANAQRKMQVVTGHRAVHNYQMRMATEQLASKVLRAANGSTGLNALVKDMGFSSEFMAKLKEDLPNIASFDGKWVKSLDLDKTADPQMVAEFIQGVQRGARQIIQGSYRGEGMRAQTSAIGQLLTQFRSFSFLAMEKQWARTAGTVGIPVATALMVGQMMTTLPVYLARTYLNAQGKSDQKREEYLKQNLSPYALVRQTMNYAGLTGLLGDSLDVPTAAYSAITGKDARTGENAKTGAWGIGSVVPGLSYVDNGLRSAYGVLKKPSFENAAKFGRNVLPGGNIPYFAFAMNAAQQQ